MQGSEDGADLETLKDRTGDAGSSKEGEDGRYARFQGGLFSRETHLPCSVLMGWMSGQLLSWMSARMTADFRSLSDGW